MMTIVSPEEIKYLERLFGNNLTATMAGTSLAPHVVAWWCEGYMFPSHEESERLQFAATIMHEATQRMGSETAARDWFLHCHVGTDRTSVARAIRAGRLDEVRTSVKNLAPVRPIS